jgi:hypothetical protein
LFCNEAVTLARSFCSGPWKDDALAALASLATTKSTHAERDLHTWLTDAFGIELEPYYIDVTVRATDPALESETIRLATVPFYEYIAAAYALGPKVFNTVFVGPGGMDEMYKFWTNARRLPFGANHSGLAGDVNLSFVLPIQHHCDGAAFMNKVEYNIFSISSATTVGDSIKQFWGDESCLESLVCCKLDFHNME